ncbi:serine 3-dehydrogenase [Delitschia confertaspora ATCC 74209]|uniref:Serine 3-dehydrogenase n=1 Tax=Delitschia confertaspora ATCC 74209 TaxID=1513339 RepID=A0A9P4JKF6_9PLEO|nr:serine 3-dehydrogenase [Delitschia confertaspora ATCC 74209]
MPSATNDAKVWFITGCSTGFGKQIAEAALKRGDVVVATARKLVSLNELKEKGAVIRELDVTWSDEQLSDIVSDVLSIVGRIDILVNNAGYILTGGVEEVSREEALHQYTTNVFGQLNVSRAILPHMRSRRSGVICNMASIGSYRGVAGAGLYCASKAACSLHSEALRAEVAHLGIEVVAVEPGYFRTNFLTSSNRKRAGKRIEDIMEPVETAVKTLDGKNLKQPGNPVKGAELLVEALTKSGRCEGRSLPARLALGSDAVKLIPEIMDKIRGDIDDWKELTQNTSFDE